MKCIENEIPFEVPEGWEWARIFSISNELPYGTAKKSSPTGKVIVLRMGNIQNGEVDYSDIVYSSDDYDIEKYRLIKGDLLFNRTNSSEWVGKTSIYRGDFPAIYAGYIIRLRTPLNSEYLNAVMNSSYAYQYCRMVKTDGVNQSNINAQKLGAFLIPVAPFSEQSVIAQKIEEVIPLINSIAESKSIVEDTSNYIKSKVLDLAIRGKLVPQDPNDEPASFLLERIRIEKEVLIKQGKLKRDKKESVIYKGDDNSYYEKLDDGSTINIDEDLPFDIPETWCWSRLSSLCRKEIKRGKTPKYVGSSGTLVFAQKCNLKKGGIDYTLAQYLDESTLSKYDASEFIRCGDTVINSTGTGTLGRVGFIDSLSEHPIVPDSHVTTIRAIAEMDPFYIFILLKSLQPTLEKSGEGSTNQKELKPNTLQDIFVPIPPIEEQKRICNAVQNSYGLIKDIEDSIN